MRSGMGSDRRKPAFASRQNVVRPHMSQLRINRRTESLNLGQKQHLKIVPTIVSLLDARIRSYHVFFA